jgi:hypothetical protein
VPHNLFIQLAAILGLLHVVSPLALRATYRFSGTCDPIPVDGNSVPPLVRDLVGRCAPKFESLGFTFLGYFDVGPLVKNAKAYLAYFVNRSSGVFANVSVVTSAAKTVGYFEFSTTFTNGLTLDANTNKTLPLTPARPNFLVFRFPEVFDPVELFQIHRALIQKYGTTLQPQMFSQGQETGRIKSQIGQYAAEQAKTGYMYRAKDGQTYRLTWKGAILLAWKALWPTSMVRGWLYRVQMKRELRSLCVNHPVGTSRTA